MTFPVATFICQMLLHPRTAALGLPILAKYGDPDFVNLLLPIGYTPAFQGKNEGLVLEDPMAPLLLGKTTLTVSLVKVRYG